MVEGLRFDNRVVIVTGAGGGIGRVYALFFASRGASVVVNDLGVSRSGDGSNSRAADAVVEEIRKAGGKAAANYDSVEDGDKIVETAMKAFGRVDVIVNNAGILRDKGFARMTDQDWDLVQRVHLRGSYKVTKAAWPIFLKQKYGRVIMTASAAGIYGNFGQSSYSAAKLGLAGFAFSLAREGAKSNILVNTIAPLAASRMTEAILPPEILQALKPEFISPLVAFLCHESNKETGGLFEVGAGYVGKLRWERSQGVLLKCDASLTPGAVATAFSKVNDFRGAEYPESIVEKDWIGLVEKGRQLKSNEEAKRLRFDGKVVIVTGAGAGLGRAYALAFARDGASLVINDLGVSTTGTGTSSKAADVVVEEIRQMGGKAVANYDSVEDGDKIVETAVKAFGRIDIVVNNAGILRDKSFVRATDQDWDLVHRVHLRGSYKVARAAWPFMVKQNYGRIINTSSAVGLYGNYGQANYSAAKCAIIGLSNTLAIEGKKNNIVVNTICPNAGTRMTATVLPPEIVEALKPDFVAPFVEFLAHESNDVSGGVFEVGSGWIGRVRWQRSGGVGFPITQPLQPEHIQSKWSEITSFNPSTVTYPSSTADSLASIVANASKSNNGASQGKKSGNKTSSSGSGKQLPAGKVDIEKARTATFKVYPYSYKPEDVILYNLGVGAARKDVKYTYETHEDFSAVASFGCIPGFESLFGIPLNEFLPPYNPMMLFHGEQYTEIVKPIKRQDNLFTTSKIVDILDKGKGVAVLLRSITKNDMEEVVLINEATVFIMGITNSGLHKNWQVERKPFSVADNKPPKGKKPDFVIKQKITEEQAALYRLCADRNPLHIDPEMAAMGGFDKPILHGLCTFGYASRHVVSAIANDDAKRVKAIKVRFSTPVFPGETIQTEIWKCPERKDVYLFQVRAVERDVIAIAGGALELHAGMAAGSKAPVAAASNFSSQSFFDLVKVALLGLPETLKKSFQKVPGVLHLRIRSDSDAYSNLIIDFKNAAVLCPLKNDISKLDGSKLYVFMDDSDFVRFFTGQLPLGNALMNAKLKVSGDLSLLPALQVLVASVRSKL